MDKITNTYARMYVRRRPNNHRFTTRPVLLRSPCGTHAVTRISIVGGRRVGGNGGNRPGIKSHNPSNPGIFHRCPRINSYRPQLL